MNNKIVLLVGRSGSGKTTVANILRDRYGRSILQSYTTRLPRFEGEDGHIFVTFEDWEKVFRSHDIVAYTEFDGNYYWATTAQVEENDIYIIDPDGVNYVQAHYHGKKQIYVIWLDCSPYIALRRMNKEGRKDAYERSLHDIPKFFSTDSISPDLILHVDDSSPEEIASIIEEVFNND